MEKLEISQISQTLQSIFMEEPLTKLFQSMGPQSKRDTSKTREPKSPSPWKKAKVTGSTLQQPLLTCPTTAMKPWVIVAGLTIPTIRPMIWVS